MKVEENTPGTEKIPTREEQIKYLKGEMPFKRLQVELQKLNTDFAELKVREFEAISKLDQIQQVQNEARANQEKAMMENIVEHTISQEDMDINPELKEAGIVVGQTIGIPKDIYYTDQVKLANKVSLSDDKPAHVNEALDNVKEDVDSTLKVVKD